MRGVVFFQFYLHRFFTVFFFCSAINAKLLSEEHKICHISAYFIYFKSINSFKTNLLFFFKKQKQDKTDEII